MRKILLLTFITSLVYSFSFGQSFSNKGKDFWIPYPEHIDGTASTMGLYITSDVNTSGTIFVGATSVPFTVVANSVSPRFIGLTAPVISTNANVYLGGFQDNVVSGKGIRVVSDLPVVVFAHIIRSARSGATLVLPSNVWGKEYIIPSYVNTNNTPATANSYAQINVFAEKINTVIEITPTIATRNGLHPAGVPYQVTLPNIGDVYQLQFPRNLDPSGTIVKSIASGTSGCNKIGVFASTTWSSIGCANASGGDNLYQQLFPSGAWGKLFMTGPLKKDATVATDNNTDMIRVFVKDPTTIVTKMDNGVITTLTGLTAGNFYEYSAFRPTYIQADKPVQVIQYIRSQSCGSPATNSDPEMIAVSALEQTINDITVFSAYQANVPAGQSAVTTHYLNVIMKTANTSSFKINGFAPSAAFIPITGTPFSFLKENVTNPIAPRPAGPVFRLQADSGFNAIAYGFGNVESYGYNAGTNVRDFNQQLFTPSQYGIINDGSSYACLNTPFKFSVYLPDSALSNSGPTAGTNVAVRFDSMRWSVTNAANFVPNNFPVMVFGTGTPPIVPFDSINIRNGKPVAWYSLPTQYSITAPGTYIISVRGYRTNSSGDGCTSGNETDFEFTLVVPPAPIATFTNSIPGCPADSVRFTETNPQTPYSSSTYLFTWNFGEPSSGAGNTSTIRNPVHAYASPGTYDVTFSNISTAGCISATTTQQVIVPSLVNVTLTGTTALCQNQPAPNLNFTITDGLPPYKINYTLSTNGGAAIVQTPIITSLLTNTLSVPTNIAGSFVYNITSIENANAAFCTRVITGQTATVTINPLPAATIAGSTVVCQGTPAPLITFTGSNATAPYTFTYNIDGGPNQTVTTISGNSVTVSIPTTTIGTYTYNLVSVVDASSTFCTNPASGSAVVTIQATSTATISGTTSLCQDATAPIITFTAANGTAPFTFSYNINGGATQTIVTSAISNSATITVPMTAAGTFVYNLLSVQNTGPTTCITPITGTSATVVINPNPTATIGGSTIVCQNTGIQNITFTGAGGTTPYTFTYNINGGPSLTVTTLVGNSVTVPVSSATIGIFTYTLTLVTDASSTLCTTSYTTSNTATVQVQATSTATISGTAAVCQDATAPVVTFTGSNGNAPFTFEYNINGGATQTISTTAVLNSVTLSVPMSSTGTFVYNLLSVKNTGPILCLTPITGASATIIIRPIPAATITGTTTVCQNTTAPLITFTGANATAPYTFTYTINGGAPQTVSTIAGNSVSVAAPTGAAGTFVYELTQVQESSSTQCIKTYTNSIATVIVNQIATASISGTTTVCQAGTTPVITFTAVGGVAPFTFAYTLNGSPLTVTTTVGNAVTVSLPTTTPGTFVYNLLSVQESSGLNCVNNQTGTVTIIIHPKPTASYTTTAPYCAQNAVTFTPSFGITPTGSVVSWVWNYGDGTGTQIRIDGNPFTLTYPTAGVKPVSFKVVSDNGCESNLATTPAVIINSKPKAGFINPAACLADAFAQFTDTSTVVGGSIVFWEWDFGDGTPILSGSTPAIQNPLHAFLTVGNKTVKLIVTTNSGCKDTVIQSFFINGEVTSADFLSQNGGNFCSNRPVQIKENSVVNVGGLIRVDIYWDNVGAPVTVVTDNLPTPGKIYSHSYPNLQVDRTYNVRYIAYSGFNGVCQKEVTKIIIVRASPVASFATPIDVCLNGGTVQLQGSEIGGVGGTSTYIGTGVSATGLFNPLTATPGTYNITYTAISPNGCDSALVRPIRVLTPPVADFTTVGNVCVGGPGNVNVVTFTQNSTVTAGQGGSIVKWIYDWGDGTPVQTFTTGANVTHAYATAGPKTAYLIVEDAYGCRNALPGKALNFTVNPLPTPSYTFTASACLPNANILFTNTTANLVSNSYDWSFALPSTAAGDVSTATNPSHIYTTQGPFNTQLVATNTTTGCKDSTAIIVINGTTIHPEPVVVFTPMADICLNNGTRQLTQGSETSGMLGGPGIYSGPGVSASGLFNPLIAGVGTHILTYTFTSSFNCPASKTQTIKVLAPPVVNTFVTVGNKCERNNIVFSNTTTSTEGIVASWVYNWGDGTAVQTASNGNNITHVYATAGTYTATLTLITDYGCNSSPAFPVSVVVNPIPRPNFTYSDTACLPIASVLFKNTTPNITDWAYTWNFDVPSVLASDISTQQSNITHLYYTQAPHTVRLIAVSGLTGCTDSIFKPITTIHPAPFANFDFNKLSACIGQDVRVIDRSTFADGTGNKWEWSWDDGTTSVGQNPSSKTYSNTRDNYNVKLKITNSFGCVDDTTKIFAVYELPTANAGKDSVILLGGNLTLTPIVTGRNLSYAWSGIPAPENLSSKVIKNPIASPLEDITYKLIVTGIGGCIAPADFVFIKVLKAPIIPNTFTPNNDGVHDTWIIKYLESYPENRVQVFTRAGQLVFESRRYLKPWDGNVNGKPLPFDTYYYIIEPGSGRAPITGYVTIVK